MFGLKINKYDLIKYNFQLLDVVDRASETQPQVVENLNNLT